MNSMFWVLLSLPILCVIALIFLYQQNGRREILRFDSYQFFMTFLIFPAVFIWFKGLLIFLLRQQTDVALTVRDLFAIDSFFSVLFLYMFAFITIHTVTKSFELKTRKDPLYDMFQHSEWFHLWFSHVFLYGTMMVAMAAVATLNIIIPFDTSTSRLAMVSLCSLGIITGFFGYVAIKISDPKIGGFMRLMKLGFSLVFLYQSALFFLYTPRFSLEYGAYWFMMSVFSLLVVESLFFDRFPRLERFVNARKPKRGET